MAIELQGSERVQPALEIRSKTITVKVSRENDTTTIDNGMGLKWKLDEFSTGLALTAMIAHTLEIRERALSAFADKFEINLTIEEIIY